MATPTLTMIPSGYKAEKVYSVLPTNGDGDFTFNRNDTGTRINKSGLREQVATDIPRLDYSDGSCPSLLLEPQSTNLITKSNEVTSVGGAIITLNAAISLDGTLNAFKIKFTGGSSNAGGLLNLENQTANFAANTLYTLSFYAKNLVGDGGFTARIDTDVSIVKQQPFTATSNWQRFTVSFTTDAGSTKFSSNCRFKNFQQNGEVLFYGVQLEKQPFATSLIPTINGIESRNSESATNAGNSNLMSTAEGVLYAEIAALNNDLSDRRISLSDGTLNNLVYISFDTSSNRILVNANGKVLTHTVSDETEFHKIAVLYNPIAPKLFVNGVLIGTATAMNQITALNQVRFDGGVGNNVFIGKAKCVAVFKDGLTDAELVALTTI